MNPDILQNEKIKIIDGYGVTSLGRVWSYKRNRWLKLSKCKKGYIHLKKGTNSIKVHRLVAVAFIPNPNMLPQVNHINGIKTDNTIQNLEWCNNSYNGKHANALGLKHHQGMRYKNNPSRFVGVRPHSNGGFRARYKHKQVEYSKWFKNEIDAAKWYNEQVTRIYGDKARLNIVEAKDIIERCKC